MKATIIFLVSAVGVLGTMFYFIRRYHLRQYLRYKFIKESLDLVGFYTKDGVVFQPHKTRRLFVDVMTSTIYYKMKGGDFLEEKFNLSKFENFAETIDSLKEEVTYYKGIKDDDLVDLRKTLLSHAEYYGKVKSIDKLLGKIIIKGYE